MNHKKIFNFLKMNNLQVIYYLSFNKSILFIFLIISKTQADYAISKFESCYNTFNNLQEDNIKFTHWDDIINKVNSNHFTLK